MNKNIFLLLLSLFCNAASKAQSVDNQKDIKNTIHDFFEGMKKVDSSITKKNLASEATLQTILTQKDGSTTLVNEKIIDFLKTIGTPHKGVWEERVLTWDIRIDGAMASAWCDYAFYVDEKFSHCGVDAFLLMKKNGQWQILNIIDTRRKESCEIVTSNVIDTVMNRWHHAAAVADEDVFFGLMTENCDYIGTDPSEHWKRDELKKWSEKFFQRDSAWDFSNYSGSEAEKKNTCN